MNNSNQTLRFPRSYREATGTDCHLETRNHDRPVWIVTLIGIAFVAGMMVGGVI